MAERNGHEKMPSITSTLQTSSSSDSSEESGSASTPNTPPSPAAALVPQMMIVEPQVVKNEKDLIPQKRSPKRTTPPKSRLGAIDEHSDSISPDLPVRNPRRLLGGMQHSRLFQLAFQPTLYHPKPPKPLYDDIEGPRGEKLGDVRKNQKVEQRRLVNWKKLVCLGLLLLMVAAVVAIILIAVLLTRKRHSAQSNNGSNNSTAPVNVGFPTGTYAIQSYLNTTDSSCTSNPNTWRCFPYETYSQSATASFSTLQWQIKANSTGSNNTTPSYLISTTDGTFSYPFFNRPLTLENNGTANEAYTFTFPYVKTVYPTVALTSDGATTRCYFNNTLVVGRLFTEKAKQAALSAASMNNSTNPAWAYALDFVETIQAGANVPNCYKYANGVDGERVNVDVLSQSDATCRCVYANYGF